MNIKNIIRNAALLAMPLMSVMAPGVLSSCSDDNIDAVNYYTATKRTAAQLISDNPERYSMFQEILEKANYYRVLSTYGTYTVFAPDNDAVKKYLAQNGYNSVQDIPDKNCDTLARTHIVNKGAFFTTDYMAGTLPEMNMDDRYLVITCDEDVDNNSKLRLFVNKKSQIVQKDDSVTNGVVHTINSVLQPSNDFLPDLMAQDQSISIFVEALKLTNLSDSISKYLDASYSLMDEDSARVDNQLPMIRFGGRDNVQYFPAKRYFKYTAFVEPNDVLKEKGNIENLTQLKRYAEQVYHKMFPEDGNQYDSLWTDRRNPLNRFVAYHLMDRIGNYSDWAPTGDILTRCCKTNIAEAEDFWQTMLDKEGMIRFTRAGKTEALYANRKMPSGIKGIHVRDALESGNHEQNALNGVYHYLDDILVYDTRVREQVLNSRMRIDATTLSADFMNQACRGHYGTREDFLYCLKNDYIKGWKVMKGTGVIAVHADSPYWSSYLGNAICVKGQYDVEIDLPSPPPGTYEIRLAYVAGEERGVVQVFLNNEPCDIPVDLTRGVWDPEIGGEIDDTLPEDEINANDKAMHNRGYMRGMDSYGKLDWPEEQSFRTEAKEHVRRILTTAQFEAGKKYKLRFRQVAKGDKEWSFDYIELCPKSVFASAAGEDRH